MTRFDGLEDCTYTVTWTRNGKGWYTAAFEERDEAREFVADMIRENEGNRDFLWYAQRLATLDSADFLDDSVPDVLMRFANPWLCGNNGEDEEDVDETGDGEFDAVRRALLDVMESWLHGGATNVTNQGAAPTAWHDGARARGEGWGHPTRRLQVGA